jgi:uncharacterized coiled-coil protein SlyX
MFQADLDELRQQVRDLTNRISRLEESLAAREGLLPTQEAEPPALRVNLFNPPSAISLRYL